MMRAIVLILCLAAAGGIAAYTQLSGGDSGEPVYTVPTRAPVAAPAPPPPAAATPIDPSDRAALARALQGELKRVGCYQGEITGVWTTSSRLAMKTFNERVNAALPVDAPDPVLLSLVQGHRERACDGACPAGQTADKSGACVANPVLATAGSRPDGSGMERPAEALPAAGAAAVAATAAAVALAKPDPKPGANTEAKGSPEPKASGPAAARPVAAPPGGSVPPEGMVRERRPRRSAEAPPRPPKLVRDFLRTLGFK
jgi:hypothetical protein